MPNHLRPLTTQAVLSAGLLLAGCGNDVDGESATSSTATPTTIVVVTSVVTVPDTPAPTTGAQATTTAATVSPTSPSTAQPGGNALDWDGVRYDFGRITGLSSNENEDLLTFDRYQLYGDDGELQSAPDFTEEVLTLANRGRLECGGNEGEAPEWQSNTVDDLFAAGTPDSDQVSLMFSDEGKVTLIRVSESC